MQRQGGGIPAILIVMVVLGIFGILLAQNATPAAPVRVIIPTEVQPTAEENAWESILRDGFGSQSTPLPTIAIPTGAFIPPTLALAAVATASPLLPEEIASGNSSQVVLGATPTIPQATSVLQVAATQIPVTAIYVTQPPQAWQPPPLIPPLSRDPLGRDHYWFMRPVDSNANNRGLFYYPYGSDGPDNEWRIHSGLDMPNPIGETVRAAGSGFVTWAGSGFQQTSSYGIVVRIEHDFGYDGQRLYSLYAHLASVLVVPGQYVQAGDPIGLVGNTGNVTGPHVHFEIRLDRDEYGSTVNPALWMVPYVGTGIIAGRVTDQNGDWVLDADVTVRDWARGLITDTTTTYIFRGTTVDMNSDPVWNENFVVADVPVGRYEVITTIYGNRVSQIVDVVEGTTSFVELSLQQLANSSN